MYIARMYFFIYSMNIISRRHLFLVYYRVVVNLNYKALPFVQ